MTSLPWVFEPCSPEDATDYQGTPWPHAVRGRKPAGHVVIGYGLTEEYAGEDARNKAQVYDANEMLGQRGETVTQLRLSACTVDTLTMITVYDVTTGDAIAQGQLVSSDFYIPPMRPRFGFGSVWTSSDFSMMSIGT